MLSKLSTFSNDCISSPISIDGPSLEKEVRVKVKG